MSNNDLEYESSQQNLRDNLFFAFLLFSTFSLCELFVGWRFHSVALVSDAAAMIIDSLSFVLNYFAVSYVHEYSVWAKIVAPLLSLSILYILVLFFFLPDAMNQIWSNTQADDQFQFPILDIAFPIINALIDGLVLYRFLPKLNFNDMNEVSATIHAWADTGRTIAVSIAGLVAEVVPSLSPDYCDGWYNRLNNNVLFCPVHSRLSLCASNSYRAGLIVQALTILCSLPYFIKLCRQLCCTSASGLQGGNNNRLPVYGSLAHDEAAPAVPILLSTDLQELI